MKADLWEGHSKHPGGWDLDLYVTYTVAAIMIGTALGLAPDTSIQTWARQEAEARLALKAQGFDAFEFGTHYQTTSNNELEWDKFNAKVRTKMSNCRGDYGFDFFPFATTITYQHTTNWIW